MSKDNNDSVWLYSPSFPLSIVVAVLYLFPTLAIAYSIFKHRGYVMTVVVIGSVLEVVGYALRASSAKNQSDVGSYAASLTLIILAPILVAAGDYLLISRLIRAVLPSTKQRILRVPATWLTKIFVTCDVLTFLIQGSGSGVASSGDWKGPSAATGQYIIIGGLALQLLTFGFFSLILARFMLLARETRGPGLESTFPKCLRAVVISAAMIIIRCIYRLIEFATGINGYLFTHEWPYYVLEGLPMLIAITAFAVYFPPKHLSETAVARGRVEKNGVVSHESSDDNA